MIDLGFENMVFDGRSDDFRELELGLVAEFELRVGGRVTYREPGFTIFELRLALAQWLEGQDPGRGFEFVSVESDEPELVWFRGAAGWWVSRRVGASGRHRIRRHLHRGVPSEPPAPMSPRSTTGSFVI